ncbi:MAG: hypothetical protein KGL53_10270 [Elusimicrobia bacterium]|nr:hypothetical protein [Elusimicrobiota bacterium]
MDKRSLTWLAVLFGLLLGLELATRERGAEAVSGPVTLEAAAGGSAVWNSCAAAQCVTVYVAPWCSVCRASIPFINAFVDYLQGHGVPARVVVGQGSPAELRAYAKEFGPRTLLDVDGRVPLEGGVPQFLITSAAGRVIRRQPGLPRIFTPPISADDIRGVARALGLL